MDLPELLGAARIVPVVVIDDAGQAVALAETLLSSGIGIMEITLRTPSAYRAIENVARNLPEMSIGAGSIRNAEHMQRAHNAGAQFVVSPGATDKLVSTAILMKMPLIPGATTPSEMLALFEQGFSLQKLFPAEIAGGIDLLKAVAGPIPEVSFMPTGGISPELATDYLALPNVVAIGGSWIAPTAAINNGEFDQIARNAVQAVQQASAKVSES